MGLHTVNLIKQNFFFFSVLLSVIYSPSKLVCSWLCHTLFIIYMYKHTSRRRPDTRAVRFEANRLGLYSLFKDILCIRFIYSHPKSYDLFIRFYIGIVASRVASRVLNLFTSGQRRGAAHFQTDANLYIYCRSFRFFRGDGKYLWNVIHFIIRRGSRLTHPPPEVVLLLSSGIFHCEVYVCVCMGRGDDIFFIRPESK